MGKFLGISTFVAFDMITITSLKQTCYACPSQWSGVGEDGEDIYIRYRHGGLSASVDGQEVHFIRVGDAYDGVLNSDDMMQKLCAHFDFSML